MITLLFWNIAKNPVCLEHLPCLVETHDIDVFILAECPESVNLEKLNAVGKGNYQLELNANAKVRAITRLDSRAFIHRYTSLGREMAVWSTVVPKTTFEVLVAGVHLTSKFGGTTDADQTAIASEINLIGIHGLMTQQLADRPDRLYRQKLRRSFYNPMWGLFGDRTAGPPGSHYWQTSVLSSTHWAILDQVLVRPVLTGNLKNVVILETDGKHSLLDNKGAPSSKHLSDHLPVLTLLGI